MGLLYYKNGILQFKGEYLNDEKNGKGIEYDNIKFVGEYLNGKKNGKGKQYFHDYNYHYTNYSYLIYEGEYLNNYMAKR